MESLAVSLLLSLPDMALKRPVSTPNRKRNNNVMKCTHCEGELKQIKVSYTANRNGYHLILDEVPAWSCQRCGRPSFDETTMSSVQGFYENLTNTCRN